MVQNRVCETIQNQRPRRTEKDPWYKDQKGSE